MRDGAAEGWQDSRCVTVDRVAESTAAELRVGARTGKSDRTMQQEILIDSSIGLSVTMETSFGLGCEALPTLNEACRQLHPMGWSPGRIQRMQAKRQPAFISLALTAEATLPTASSSCCLACPAVMGGNPQTVSPDELFLPDVASVTATRQVTVTQHE